MLPEADLLLLQHAFAFLQTPIAIVDIESTGGHQYHDRITEVAAVRFDERGIHIHEWLINPQQPISAFIEQLTGISNEMVATAPCFADVAAEIEAVLHGAVMVAHNSRFDSRFLQHAFRRCQRHWSAPNLCTVKLSRRLYPNEFKHNLDSIIERFQLQLPTRHRALADVAALVLFLAQSLREHPLAHWQQQVWALLQPRPAPAWLPESLRQAFYCLPDSHGVAALLADDGTLLHLAAHSQLMQEVGLMLGKAGAPERFQAACQLDYQTALGPIHAQVLRQDWQARYPQGPSNKPNPAATPSHYTIHFIANAHGQLQAQVQPLHPGSYPQPPYGVFLHPRAAKKALLTWVHDHGLCPHALGLTHLDDKLPCPIAAIGQCDGHCQDAQMQPASQQRILMLAAQLPVVGWPQGTGIRISETDPFSGETQAFECRGGAVRLANGGWYFDAGLFDVIKSTLKSQRDCVERLD